MATRRKAAASEAPAEEDAFEDLDDIAEDDDGLEELEDEVEEEPVKPAKRGRPKATPAKKAPVAADNGADEAYNSAWLAEHVNEMTGESHDARSIRMLLRKMAADGTLPREVGVDRSRYTFPRGERDPIVLAVVKRVKAGELKVVKRESLDKVKQAAAPAKKATRRAPAEEEPVKRTRAKAAPAKATPAVRRKRAAAAQ